MSPFLIFLIVLIVLAFLSTTSSSSSNNKSDVTKFKGNKDSISRYSSRALMLILIFFVLSVNFFGLSLALQCNRDENFITKTFIGIFAFMFSFIYIIFSYYMYRVKKGYACNMCSNNPFPFF